MFRRAGFSRIGPTAHYTGYVWARNGLAHRELATTEGRILFDSLQPTMLASRALGGPTLEAYLLARHRAIDALLERAIERDGVGQVIEVAAGLSPRGWRFTQRYGERLVYVEADLPEMAARKRAALERMGSLSERHRVREVDALRDDEGPGSLAAVLAELDDRAGLAIITEGLLGYLPPDAVAGMWRRFATGLGRFSTGRYISDVHIGGAVTPPVRVFRVLLSGFVRGRVYLHFGAPGEAVAALGESGFAAAEVRRAAEVVDADRGGSGLAHILEASTR
ncbi:MAG TPA: class I SAM-dependent methyltransferase [Solirubrobacteraceae bacterium]|nr:class I SAM-dependent methyltransferase [Solirubrobacteraceae bacterium]